MWIAAIVALVIQSYESRIIADIIYLKFIEIEGGENIIAFNLLNSVSLVILCFAFISIFIVGGLIS